MRRDIPLMAALVLIAAVFRFTGLSYSAPFHFHVDEHPLLTPAADLAAL